MYSACVQILAWYAIMFCSGPFRVVLFMYVLICFMLHASQPVSRRVASDVSSASLYYRVMYVLMSLSMGMPLCVNPSL